MAQEWGENGANFRPKPVTFRPQAHKGVSLERFGVASVIAQEGQIVLTIRYGIHP